MKWARSAIFGLICLLCVATALYGGGQQEQEDPIETARSLIEEGRLNEAIMVLQETIREHPERIREAEKLLTRIRELRSDYNDLFAALIDTLRNNPDDLQGMLEIIDHMEQLDENPNPRVESQVTQARVVAQLAYDREQVRHLMEEAAAQIEAGDWVAAVQTYLEGFQYQREEFEDTDYPTLFVNVVNEAVRTLREGIDRFPTIASRYRAAANPLTDALRNRSVSDLQARFAAYAGEYNAIRELSESVREAGASLAAQREQVPQVRPEREVDWYLTFMEQYVFGREGQREREGILTAAQLLMSSIRDRVHADALVGAQQIYESATGAFEEEDWAVAAEEFRRAAEIARYGVRNSVLNRPELSMPELERARDALSGEALRRYLQHRSIVEGGGGLAKVASVRAAAAEVAFENTREIPALEQARADLTELVSRSRAALSDLQSFRETAEEIGSGVWEAESATRISNAVDRAEGSLALVTAREIGAVRRLASLELEPIETTFQTLGNRVAGAQELLTGIPQSTPPSVLGTSERESASGGAGEASAADGTDTQDAAEGPEDGVEADASAVLYRYPEVALTRLQVATPAAVALAEEVSRYLSEYRDEPDYVRSDEEISAFIERAHEIQQRLAALQTAIAGSRVSAESQIVRAEQLREEYRSAVARTEQAISNLNVDQAEQAFEEAQRASLQALALQQDPNFRQERDAQISELGIALQDARNRIVVQQVRQLISVAQQQYDTEQFIQARNTLNRARELWSQTNVNENPEIERLAGLVNVALEFEQERNVTEAEPLYAVLSGYLNVAREQYNRAQEFLSNGNNEEASAALQRANDALDNVLAIRPYNWEARVLKLRILERQNPEDFQQLFERRFQDALAIRDEDPQEALTSLETLNQINPDYPGIDREIRRLEISLGLQPDPIEQAEIQRSNELFSQARELASGGSAPQIQSAMQLLEQAVTLNPNNSEAQLLLDELRIRSGGEATAALNSEDQQRFQNAQNAFLDGNVATALSIVSTLMQEEENRQYPPLRDLVRNLEQALGRELEFN